MNLTRSLQEGLPKERWRCEARGEVRLTSGWWDCFSVDDRSGWRLYFRHLDKPSDRMLSWSSLAEITPCDIEQAATHPLFRYWEDEKSILWRVSVEHPRLPFASRMIVRPELTIVLTSHRLRVQVPTRGEPPIGEFTDQQLSDLLNRAGQRGQRSSSVEVWG